MGQFVCVVRVAPSIVRGAPEVGLHDPIAEGPLCHYEDAGGIGAGVVHQCEWVVVVREGSGVRECVVSGGGAFVSHGLLSEVFGAFNSIQTDFPRDRSACPLDSGRYCAMRHNNRHNTQDCKVQQPHTATRVRNYNITTTTTTTTTTESILMVMTRN